MPPKRMIEDPVERELEFLADKAATLRHIERCPVLLSLLPAPLGAADQPAHIQSLHLLRILKAVAQRAFEELADRPGDKELHEVLALAAMMGLITKVPAKDHGRSPIDMEERVSVTGMQHRRQIGGTWLARPVDSEKSVREKKPELFKSFRYALLTFLADEQGLLRLDQRYDTGTATSLIRKPSNARDVALDRKEIDATHDPRYARRDSIHEEFSRAVRSGKKRILLSGQAGMGKTRLARELPKEHAPQSEILYLRDHSQELLSSQLVAAFNRYEPDVILPVSPSVHDFLAGLLAARNGPRFIILDGVPDPAELARLVPDSINATVIATCRNSANVPSGWQTVRVSRMTEAESRDMITRALPELANEEVARFSDCFHGYPLVIKYACVLLEQGPLNVSDFIEAFGANRKYFMERTPSDEGAFLSDILKLVVELVRQRSEEAARLLGGIGTVARLCGHGDLSHEYLSAYLLICAGENLSGVKPTLTYLAALQTLREFSFIEQEELGCVRAHPLVAEVLSALVEGEFAEISENLIATYAQLLPPGTRSGYGGWWNYRSYSEAVTRRMGHTLARELAYMHIYRVMARLARIWSIDEPFGSIFAGLNPDSGGAYFAELSRRYLLNNLAMAVAEDRKNPKITWQVGRTAYNLIEGHGARLEFLLSESRMVKDIRLPSMEELRKRFRNMAQE